MAQLGSAFVLGTKCHRFKSCHPYLLPLRWAVTRNQLRSIPIGRTRSFFFSFYKTKNYMHSKWIGIRKRILFFTFRVLSILKNKKTLLVQLGRTRVSKTRCRRFKSYRAWFFLRKSNYIPRRSGTFTAILIWSPVD